MAVPRFAIGGSSSTDRLIAVDLDITSHTSWNRMVWSTERQAIGDFRDLLYATSTGVTGDVGAPEHKGDREGEMTAAS
ncbi:hypothetical protein [Gordonia sp. NPDC003429]